MKTYINKLWNIALAFSSDCRRIPDAKEAVFLLVLVALGLLGNHLNIKLFFGVNFLFGSIATMIAIRSSGALWGTLVGIAIGSYTYVVWGHGYAIIIFGLEAFVVGFIVCGLKKDNIVLADVGYWLFGGMPLVWVFYTYQLGLPESPVQLIALKQAVNGIANVLIANLLLQLPFVSRWGALDNKAGTRRGWSVEVVLNSIIAVFVFVPMLLSMTLSNQAKLREIQSNLQSHVITQAEGARGQISLQLQAYSSVLKSFTEAELTVGQIDSWRSAVDKLRNGIIPGLLNIEITGSDGEIEFSHPQKRTGLSEYAEEIKNQANYHIYLSNFHIDDEIDEEHFTVVDPIGDGRYLVASFTSKVLELAIENISHAQQNVQVLDGSGKLVLSSDESFNFNAFIQGDNPHQLLPANEKLPAMTRWRKSYWTSTTPIMERSEWVVRMSVPMEGAIDQLQSGYIREFLTTLIIAIIALALAPFIARALASPIVDLTSVSKLLEKSTKHTDVKWPKSRIHEIDLLITQFRRLVKGINDKQNELATSENLFRTFFDNSPSAVNVKNLDGEFIFVNKLWREWFVPDNADAKTFLKDTPFTEGHKKDVSELEKLVIETGCAQEREIQTPKANHEVMITLMQKFPIFDSKKQLISIGCMNTDISELKQSQGEVIQASKLATLGEMATSVAHELNQPLNVIRMAAGNTLRTIRKGGASPEYLTEKLERITAQTARAAAIIDHMQMFGRKAAGEPSLIDPRKFVGGALDLMGEQLRLADIEIKLELPEECPSILGHQIQAEQVMLNLLTNARDAIESRAGAGEKRITLRVEAGDGETVGIIVEDTGGGIPGNVMDRIFEPFYTTKDVGKGTGLGLSVTYGIIRDMGGTILAENADRGAKFTITLPAAR